jgi:hypothetical protein
MKSRMTVRGMARMIDLWLIQAAAMIAVASSARQTARGTAGPSYSAHSIVPVAAMSC